MTLLELVPHEMKRVGNKDGGEYHGPCPMCAGTDRFHVWPHQGQRGTWWCRGCGKGGDAIEYLKQVDGMSYRDACARLGVETAEYDRSVPPPAKAPAQFSPATATTPEELWITKSTSFVQRCHGALMENQVKRDWLASRGITQYMAEKYQLGWNDKDYWRDRSAWGLPEQINTETGKPRKLWIPEGLVIPWHTDGTLHRIRIRRETGEPRYYVVPGSGRSPLITRTDAQAYVVLESELDAILIDSAAGDLVGVIAQGNSTSKPDQVAWTALQQAIRVLVSLDTDEPGARASQWWRDNLATSKRWPMIGGKDPGEAYQNGIDVRAWVMAGLPPSMLVSTVKHEPILPAAGINAHESLKPLHVSLTTRNGHQFYVTEYPAEYRRLQSDGKTVFSPLEIEEVKKMAKTQQASDVMFEVKRQFPGSRFLVG